MRLKNVSVDIAQVDQIRTRIEKRFRNKATGRMIMTLNNGTKLAVEYMYGGKYSLKRKEPGRKAQSVIMMDSVHKIASQIIVEKTNVLFNGKNLDALRGQSRGPYKYNK